MEVELDVSNYATKSDFEKCNTGFWHIKNWKKKKDLPNLKHNVDKLNIDKLKNVPSNLSSLKIKVDILNVDKLEPVPVDISKLNQWCSKKWRC